MVDTPPDLCTHTDPSQCTDECRQKQDRWDEWLKAELRKEKSTCHKETHMDARELMEYRDHPIRFLWLATECCYLSWREHGKGRIESAARTFACLWDAVLRRYTVVAFVGGMIGYMVRWWYC